MDAQDLSPGVVESQSRSVTDDHNVIANKDEVGKLTTDALHAESNGEETAAGGDHNQTTKTPSDDGRLTLLGMPPEMRNNIYHHLLKQFVEDERSSQGCVDFRKTPNITRVCRQTYSECMPMFLATTDFVLEIDEDNWSRFPNSKWVGGKLVTTWETSHQNGRKARLMSLGKLRLLGPGRVHLIKSISVEFLVPDLRHAIWIVKEWDVFISKLSGLGLQPHQLKWPGLNFDDLRMEDDEAISRIEYLASLHEGVIRPTLEAHAFLSTESPVTNVPEQADKRWPLQYQYPCSESQRFYDGDMEEAIHRFDEARAVVKERRSRG